MEKGRRGERLITTSELRDKFGLTDGMYLTADAKMWQELTSNDVQCIWVRIWDNQEAAKAADPISGSRLVVKDQNEEV